MRAEVADVILPSLRRYRAFLREVYLPRAREWPGVDRNPDGAACYRAKVYAETSLGLGADSIHSLGLAEVAALRRQMESLAARQGGGFRLDSLVNARRGDPAAISLSAAAAAADQEPAPAAEVPDFARLGSGSPALEDGWALYLTMAVAEDSLDRTDVERLDALLAASGQVCGLVVDTGIHALGWTRDSAVAYLLANSALTRDSAEAWVDRYSVRPGEALAGGSGAGVVRALQQEAADRLGAGFNLQAFHRAILTNRGTPLPVLRDNIDVWIVAKGR